MKKKIVIIGANEFQNPIILKAKDLGYETHVFSTPFGKIGEKSADYFYPISIFDKEKILEKCREIKPDAIITIASDSAVASTLYVGTNLGLPVNDYNHVLEFTNKFEMRKALQKSGILVPWFKKVKSVDEIKEINYPVVVKPTDRAGSTSIHKVSNKEELETAIMDAIGSSYEEAAIVESVIEGNEYSCETISYKSNHKILAITKKYTTGFPQCIEVGHLEPSDLTKEAIDNLNNVVPIALDALHITNGPSHVEFKVDENNLIHIIEIGGRMGGDCIGSHLVKLTTGYDYLKMTIDVALGNNPDFNTTNHKKYGIVKFIFNENDLKIMNSIIERYPDILVLKSEIDEMNHEIVDNASRYGYYILSFDDESIKENLINEMNLLS